MIRAFSLFLLALCFLFSCSDKPETPEGVLPPVKMQQVLWDVMRADELANVVKNTDSTAGHFATRVAYYQQILQMHGISKEVFQRSIRYYEQHPELFKVVMDSLQKRTEEQPKTAADSASSGAARRDSARRR